ncbi:30S ribosomal protein S17e [Candidatus Pacearchaeota archaeon]|nr:30S ribosomal protein S17e [Candidatus Pacearchaeota archaeon]
MGKIKSKMVKRAAKAFEEKGVEFNEDFEKNKTILGDNLPSKKIRNQMAGLLTRIKHQNKKEK